jgi:hypothetical protein
MKVIPILIHNPFNWKDPVSYLYALIRLATRSKYNHIAFYLEIEILGKTKRLVFEANGRGFIFVDYYYWKNRSAREHVCLNMKENEHQDEIIDVIFSLLRYKYQYLRYITYWFENLIKLLEEKWNFKLFYNYKKTHLFCFEVAGILYSFPEPEFLTGKDFEGFIDPTITLP